MYFIACNTTKKERRRLDSHRDAAAHTYEHVKLI